MVKYLVIIGITTVEKAGGVNRRIIGLFADIFDKRLSY